MIEIIKDLPSGVVGIASRGKISKEEYADIVIPAIQSELRNHDKVNILFLMDDHAGMDMSALWQDFSFGIKHWNDFDRIAFVSDVGWVRNMATAFGWMVPADIKMFHGDEVNKARAWVSHVEPKNYAA